MKPKIFLIGAIVFATAISAFTYKMSKDNTLSKSEKQQGWKLLFDGKTKNGWRYYQNKPSKSWEVNNGTLHSKGSAANYGSINADLMTKDQYDNFELSVDYKISPKGNSGILYLVTEALESSYLSGPEYQIIDDINFLEKLEDWQKTGANYAMNPAPDAEPKAVGEWNTARIIVNKGHVEHWLNWKKIVEYEIGSEEWKKNKMNGKFKDATGYGMAKKGYIALQDHGSEAWFKNVKIRKL
jgi:hypothetical protein